MLAAVPRPEVKRGMVTTKQIHGNILFTLFILCGVFNNDYQLLYHWPLLGFHFMRQLTTSLG